MANFIGCNRDFSISIPSYESVDNIAYYMIYIQIGEVNWNVNHRYKDFVELHDVLVSDHGIAKDILPPKKFIGNRDPEFIEKRKIGLDAYLKNIMTFLQKSMPAILVSFLEFNKYDIMCIVQDMAMYCYSEGDNYLQKTKNYIFNPLQLHAISRRLEKACPIIETCDSRYNFSHILDFCSHLNSITIRGGNHNVGNSNIIYNKLPFELSVFKDVSSLDFFNVNLDNIYGLGSSRQTVTSVVICNSRIKNLASALLCDKVHRNFEVIDESLSWTKLMTLDLSWNEIECIDDTIRLAPRLQHLTVDGNDLVSVNGVELSSNLTHLCLSANKITLQNSLHEKLKTIVCLNLSQNKITTLCPFSKLSTLRKLDLGSNWISDSVEIKFINDLPHLDYLVLTGNPVSTIIDYRVKVFEYFGDRAKYLCLDNERPSQKELDTAAVLRALSVVREGQAPFISMKK